MTLTDEQNKYLSELENKTIKEIRGLFEEKFGVTISETTAKKKCKSYIRLPKGGIRHGFSGEEFIELYNKHEGDIQSMIKETKYKQHSLVALCRRHKLKPKNLPSEKSMIFSPEKIRYHIRIHKKR